MFMFVAVSLIIIFCTFAMVSLQMSGLLVMASDVREGQWIRRKIKVD